MDVGSAPPVLEQYVYLLLSNMPKMGVRVNFVNVYKGVKVRGEGPKIMEIKGKSGKFFDLALCMCHQRELVHVLCQ